MGRFHESTFGVYFDDLDMFGVLHNARYLLFIERALGEFWRRLGWSLGDDPDQHHLVRANHVEYDRPVVGLGEVRVRMTVARLGRTSLTCNFQVMPMDEDLPFATAYRVLVRIDRDTRKPVPWSDGFRERLAPYLE